MSSGYAWRSVPDPDQPNAAELVPLDEERLHGFGWKCICAATLEVPAVQASPLLATSTGAVQETWVHNRMT